MKKMNENEFEAFLKVSVETYAKERSVELQITFEEALENAKNDVARHLPKGKETPNHYFFNIIAQGKPSGYLWYGVKEAYGKRKIFIFDILVNEDSRGKGCARYMLNWLEDETRKMGLSEISLHVLGRNKAARKLYNVMGFEETSIYMAKKV